MQTFLPFPDILKSIRSLDYRRLGKQRVEAMQLLQALRDPWALGSSDYYSIVYEPVRAVVGKYIKHSRWINHPCTKMWLGYEDALGYYMNECIKEWISRGYKNTMKLRPTPEKYDLPCWWGSDYLHFTHRTMLSSKEPDFYSSQGFETPARDLGVGEPMLYLWPSHGFPIPEDSIYNDYTFCIVDCLVKFEDTCIAHVSEMIDDLISDLGSLTSLKYNFLYHLYTSYHNKRLVSPFKCLPYLPFMSKMMFLLNNIVLLDFDESYTI